MKSGWRTGLRWSTPSGSVRCSRDDRRDLGAQQQAAGAGLGALADDDLDGVGHLEVGGVEPVAAGQHLVDEDVGGVPLFGQHAAVAGGGGDAQTGGGRPERRLGGLRQRAVRHAGDGDGPVEHDGLGGDPVPQDRAGLAALPVALERKARQRARHEGQVVEAGDPEAGGTALDAVPAEGRLVPDVLDDVPVPERRTRP